MIGYLKDKYALLGKKKITRDLFYSYTAFILMGLSGLALNYLVVVSYGVSVLGVYNQIYAVYVITCQCAVGGIHHSVLRHTASYADDSINKDSILCSGLLLAVFTGGLAATFLFLCSDIVGSFVDSSVVGKGVAYASFGLFFYGLNKIFLAAFNGNRDMMLFAVGQATRFLCLIGCVLICVVFDVDQSLLGLTFPVSELLTLIVLCTIRLQEKITFPVYLRSWLKVHIVYCVKGYFSQMFQAINLRIDILMLGFFTNDYSVGIYSFAAVFVEGAQALLVVVRNNLNPILARALIKKDFQSLKNVIFKVHTIIYPLLLLCFIVFFFGYESVMSFVVTSDVAEKTKVLLFILLSGFWIYSGYAPFGSLLVNDGHPGTQSLLLLSCMFLNILLNSILINLWGTIGAALATSFSFVAYVLILIYFVKRTTGICLFPFGKWLDKSFDNE
ncbi:polysaccharide biosynthesis C-terminal domain-containing protein [Maridesulfovibrio sp.]|uniref:polysaccharide biosynthesis C-terminal domain-containing protein n=1 Tax=Maridesulfovibrio sp. TaxID=2795000 RepID=UPI0029C9B291|nr:polysaccharide biosynthesis C-terminal domain-containing protein [Maridesulfovibrio sp.]